MRIYAEEYKKTTKPKIYLISPKTVVIYSPLKSRKK